MTSGYHLSDFGSYTVGGRRVEVAGQPKREIRFTPTAHFTYDPNGTFWIESLYVQYFVPVERNNLPPLILLHGGGLSGATWETTPDGRPGWLHDFLQRGFEVHVVDGVERGRAGWCALDGVWPDEAIARSLQEAWTLFRLGPAERFPERQPFAGQRFPVGYLDEFARTFVPRWTSTTAAATAAFAALLERFEWSIIICHSQGGQIAFDAAAMTMGRGAAICAIEPSGFPSDARLLTDTPVLFVTGDFMDCDDRWRALAAKVRVTADEITVAGGKAAHLDLPAERISGNSHMIMMDDNSTEIAGRVADWIDGL